MTTKTDRKRRDTDMCSATDDPTTYDRDETADEGVIDPTTESPWDQPTDAELNARFETLGDLIDPIDVPDLIRAGVEVWSYGYDYPDRITTLDEGDIWAFEDPDFPVVTEWGPFRADPAAVAKVLA